MATAVKNIRTLQASASNTAGSTTTSATFDLSTAIDGVITARIINGATGPTVGCGVFVDISTDGGTTWRTVDNALASTTIGAIYDFSFSGLANYKKLRVRFTGNTGQAVTVEAFGHETTSIG